MLILQYHPRKLAQEKVFQLCRVLLGIDLGHNREAFTKAILEVLLAS